jgi:hypothetical protein
MVAREGLTHHSIGQPSAAAEFKRCASQMKHLQTITVAFVAVAFASRALAEEVSQPWAQMLEAVQYAETAKASFAKGCLADNPLSKTPVYTGICPKLARIPNTVINAAALPFARKYVSDSQARDAIAFYVAPAGRNLVEKILREIETGRFDQLSPADLQKLDAVNKSPFGRALKDFGTDREGNSAVARAMLSYEP